MELYLTLCDQSKCEVILNTRSHINKSWPLIPISQTIPFPLPPHEPTKNESKGNEEPEIFAKERLSFIHQPVPEEYGGTYEGTLQQMLAFDLRSVRSSVYNTRMNTPFQPEPGNEIRYTKLKRLGGGSQGDVYEVVDMHTGDYWACKVIRFKPMPNWGLLRRKTSSGRSKPGSLYSQNYSK